MPSPLPVGLAPLVISNCSLASTRRVLLARKIRTVMEFRCSPPWGIDPVEASRNPSRPHAPYAPIATDPQRFLANDWQQKSPCFQGLLLTRRVIANRRERCRGARSRNRTGTELPPADFKSAASTDFAIRAGCGDRDSLRQPCATRHQERCSNHPGAVSPAPDNGDATHSALP